MAEVNSSTQIADCPVSDEQQPKKIKRDQRQYYKQYYVKTIKKQRAKNKVSYWKNREQRLAHHKEWVKSNKEKQRLYHKEYYQKNKSKKLEARKSYYDLHKNEIRARSRRYYLENKERLNDQNKARYAANKIREKEYRFRKLYGITVAEYKEMFFLQGGKCAICGTSQLSARAKYFHVDHCHATGKVRGLLCSRCNVAIGGLNDNPSLLRKAAEYLEAANQ